MKAISKILILTTQIAVALYLIMYGAEFMGWIDLGLQDWSKYLHDFLPKILGVWIPVFTPLAVPLMLPGLIGVLIE